MFSIVLWDSLEQRHFARQDVGKMAWFFNLNDGVVWGLLPHFLAGAGLSVERIGVITAVYPAVWGVSQLATGALGDGLVRKRMIAAGLWLQAVGIAMLVMVHRFEMWVAAAVIGLGAALVYPTLLAAVSDVAHPEWRGSVVTVCRLWREWAPCFRACWPTPSG